MAQPISALWTPICLRLKLDRHGLQGGPVPLDMDPDFAACHRFWTFAVLARPGTSPLLTLERKLCLSKIALLSFFYHTFYYTWSRLISLLGLSKLFKGHRKEIIIISIFIYLLIIQ